MKILAAALILATACAGCAHVGSRPLKDLALCSAGEVSLVGEAVVNADGSVTVHGANGAVLTFHGAWACATLDKAPDAKPAESL